MVLWLLFIYGNYLKTLSRILTPLQKSKSYLGCEKHRNVDSWEDASRHLYTHYDIDDQTQVVINGDRATWIR